ncbi:MAG: UDP-N-acetylglucosamine 2-epimerase (non-hydrolyzing) [Pseudomonadales bacterium]
MKILNVAGARPNFMKIAPIMAAMAARQDMEGVIVHTGQHYDDRMSRVFFEDLGIPAPRINLEVGSGERMEQIRRIAERFDPVVRREKPDAVLVVGDVTSTVACAQVAKHHGIPIVHVEAGLRSFDLEMPEEINRIETDKLSDLLFVTEPSGMENLAREGVPGKAFHVGNVMIDTLVGHLGKARALAVSERLGLEPGAYFVGTFHRPSNVDSAPRLTNVLSIIEHAAGYHPIVLPLHPRTRGSLERHGLQKRLEGQANIRIVDPLGYLDFVSLIDRARAIITDSGGIQEESTYLKVPCITMRDNTERPITVEIGSNVLAGTDPDQVRLAVDRVMSGDIRPARVPELWDGHAAERIVEILARELQDTKSQ